MKSQLTIPIAIILGGIVVAGAVYFSMRHPTITTPDSGNPALVRPIGANDHLFGNPAAPVVIVEYSDFDCDFCKNFNETMNQIIANEGTNGKVAWVYREFPLVEIHPNAFSHARAAECAAAVAGNDAFWKFADALFANQPIGPSQYGKFAAIAGISGDAFATCYANASSTLDARINADRQNALDVGAKGTPYSLILVKGQVPIVMNGAYSYDAVKQLIDQALSTR
ncbi:MAG: thioredoxin domain-containing protein [Candidatus Kaiserbacteria bacterium]|nr:thioredoxin domain-containing protein [Candidatus Kaiserbacteria bacterium]